MKKEYRRYTAPTPSRPQAAPEDRPLTNQEKQENFILLMREQSYLEGPLGSFAAPAAFPESGSSVGQYYRAKHARGEIGRFYPCHLLAYGRWDFR